MLNQYDTHIPWRYWSILGTAIIHDSGTDRPMDRM